MYLICLFQRDVLLENKFLKEFFPFFDGVRVGGSKNRRLVHFRAVSGGVLSINLFASGFA